MARINRSTWALIMSMLVLLTFSSCGGDDEPYVEPTPIPTPSASKIEIPTTENLKPVFTTEGGTATITFTASQAWTATAANDRASEWLQISPASGGAGKVSLTITTKANDTYDDRSATITIKSGTASQTVSVTQKQKDALTVTSDKVEVDGIGGNFTVEVKSNIDFEVKTDAEWISRTDTRALTSTTLQFTASENESTDKREGHITISSGTFSETITVFQSGSVPSIVLTKNEYVMGAAGGEISVELKSNVDVTVSKPNVDWISESTTRSMSTHTYVFVISQNKTYDSRTAEIVFTNTENNLREIVSITQMQQDAIVLAKKEYDVSADGGKLDLDIQTNVDFTVSVSEGWITQADTRALHKETLHFDIAAYEGEEARSATITIAGGKVTQTITINQRGKASVPKGNIAFEDPRVKEILLMHHVDTNEDGEISYAEAAEVSSIKIIFNGTDIKSFGEFKYFAGVTEISESAFTNCKELKKISFPETIEVIGNDAFKNCTSLESISIPESVRHIKDGAFANCQSLRSFTFMGLVPPILAYDSVFSGIKYIAFYVPNRSLDIYSSLLVKKEYIDGFGTEDEDNSNNIEFESVQIKLSCVQYFDQNRDGELSYDEAALVSENDAFEDVYDGHKFFLGSTNLVGSFNEFQYFTNISSLPKSAFNSKYGMTSIVLPPTITSIGERAFASCNSLTSITLLSTTPPSLGEYVFGSDNIQKLYIYVPVDAVDQYKRNGYWINFASKIYAIGDKSGQIIKFADSKVKSICVKYWDTNKDNEISIREAEAVTEINFQFRVIDDDSKISSFDEFKYFTGLKKIPNQLFADLKYLKSISLPPNFKELPQGLFMHCINLKNVNLPDELQTIGNQAFYECESLETIILPGSLKSIYYWAFRGCKSLKSIIIPKGVIEFSISENGEFRSDMFEGCDALASIVVDPKNEVYDSRDNCNAIIETKTNKLIYGIKNTTIPSSVTTIGEFSFNNCVLLKQITIPTSVLVIERYAFAGCKGLSNVTIPGGVKEIGHHAFFNCTSLSNLTLSQGIKSIGGNAFSNCNLTDISIPSSVTSIESSAFANNKLTKVYLPSSVTSIDGNPFSGNVLLSIQVDAANPVYDSRNNCNAIIETKTDKLIAVCRSSTIPSGIKEIGDGAFRGCNWLTNFVIPDGVMTIGNYAFANCELSSITIPNSVVTIGNSAFSGCYLNSIVIPTSVSSIGDNAFNSCGSLSSITLPEGLTNLGKGAFYMCVSLQKIVVPEGVKEILSNTFGDCYNLKEVVFPSSITTINNPFANCRNLESFTILAITPPAVTNLFTFDYSNCLFYVPEKAVEAYKIANGWKGIADRIFAIDN